MPVPDVAVALRIPEGTVKSRLHRSIGAMRTTLAEVDPASRPTVPGGQFA
jgi:DNA-directed RNA polymerase specialized sigma24 family protein